MDSRVVPILLASIAILLFSISLILGSFVWFLFDVVERIYPLAQDSQDPLPGILVIVGLIVAVIGAGMGLAGFAAISNAKRPDGPDGSKL